MKKSLLLLIMLMLFGFLGKTAAQNYPGVRFDPQDARFEELFRDFDFKGAFVVKAFTDENRNYYLLDFSRLPEKFEKVYFMSLSFDDNRVVNADSDLKHLQIWFSANHRYTEKEVVDLFSQMKNKTLQVSAAWSADEKAFWLQSNDKYK